MTAPLVRLRSLLSEPRPRRGSLNHFHVRALGHVSLIGRCPDTRIKCSVVFLH